MRGKELQEAIGDAAWRLILAVDASAGETFAIAASFRAVQCSPASGCLLPFSRAFGFHPFESYETGRFVSLARAVSSASCPSASSGAPRHQAPQPRCDRGLLRVPWLARRGVL